MELASVVLNATLPHDKIMTVEQVQKNAFAVILKTLYGSYDNVCLGISIEKLSIRRESLTKLLLLIK